ncbi:hypothetical protein BRADI_3g48315v3 [Brachypodium distachyon]|uniref:Uncharacterized protein n=1 Tax=Brachypodium distachyon TaxID=15368 RepID=A0A2K2D432_BRADI|nr:hypothetical protein BRADI_3g48315v3 [Brachypodium distachyon]
MTPGFQPPTPSASALPTPPRSPLACHNGSTGSGQRPRDDLQKAGDRDLLREGAMKLVANAQNMMRRLGKGSVSAVTGGGGGGGGG